MDEGQALAYLQERHSELLEGVIVTDAEEEMEEKLEAIAAE